MMYDYTPKQKNPAFNYEIVKAVGTLSQYGSSTKELNIISYNGTNPKYDLRAWERNPGQAPVMHKGITLNQAEAEELYNLLKAELGRK